MNLGGHHSRCGLQRRAGSAQVSGGTDEAATGGAKVKVSARVKLEALTVRCDAADTGTLNSAHPSGTAHLLTRITGQAVEEYKRGLLRVKWVTGTGQL